MSGTSLAATGIGIAQALSGSLLSANAANAIASGIAMISGTRLIATIIPDVTIEETNQDRLVITQHPVAIGTPVSDHAYMLPVTLVMRVGWSNSTPGALNTWGLSRVNAIYQQLLALQSQAQPFAITTPKRTYQNMLIAELTVKTDRTSEYSLMVEAHFQEVLRVTTQSTTQPSQSSQALPDQTASPTNTTQQQASPTSPGTEQSVLLQLHPGSPGAQQGAIQH
jgi:hypothetical protein